MDINNLAQQTDPVTEATDSVAQVNESDTITPEDVTTVQTTEAGVVQHLIEVPNPDKDAMEALCASVKESHDYKVSTKPVDFNFKKTVDKDTKIETLRSPVRLAMAYPSFPDGIIAILEAGGKQVELLMEAVEGVVNTAARAYLYDDVTLNAATFPYDKVSWEAISNQPKSQRRGGGIPKETWEAFAQDYTDVMPGVTGKSMEQVGNAAKILFNKLALVKTNEPVLNMLVGQLAIYSEASPNIDDYRECVEFLLSKADTFLNLSEEDLLANL
jgi:hypothetical protein